MSNPLVRGFLKVGSWTFLSRVTGFVRDDDSAWGRPVGVAALPDGSVLVSEDANDTIWRVSRR